MSAQLDTGPEGRPGQDEELADSDQKSPEHLEQDEEPGEQAVTENEAPLEEPEDVEEDVQEDVEEDVEDRVLEYLEEAREEGAQEMTNGSTFRKFKAPSEMDEPDRELEQDPPAAELDQPPSSVGSFSNPDDTPSLQVCN